MEGSNPKERCLGAVVDAALAGGIAGKSLRGLAEAAGTSHRMLIHHFGSREGLLVAVVKAVETRQREALTAVSADRGEGLAQVGRRFWQRLRSEELAPMERLFFEVYGQALQGREWALPLLDGIVENWIAPVASALQGRGVDRARSRAVARLSVAVTRGLLLDVLATEEEQEVDAAMDVFYELLSRLVHPPDDPRDGGSAESAHAHAKDEGVAGDSGVEG